MKVGLALLLIRPWRLTNEFLAGHRVRYLHPARLYLLTSILFFFAATSWIKSIHIDPINLSPAQRADGRSRDGAVVSCPVSRSEDDGGILVGIAECPDARQEHACVLGFGEKRIAQRAACAPCREINRGQG